MNKVILLGNLTRDIEGRTTAGNKFVAGFGLAMNHKWKSADGEAKEETTFVDCEAWGKTGEVIAQYFAKGAKILVEGRLKLDQWESEGQKRSKLKVVVDTFHFVASKNDAPTTNGKKPAAKPAPVPAAGTYFDGDDSGIPF